MANEIPEILVDAAKIWWLNLGETLSTFWDQTVGLYLEVAGKIIRLDIDEPGGFWGVVGMAIDAASELFDSLSSLVTGLATGPFLAVMESLAVNFTFPKGFRSQVVTVEDALRTGILLFADRARDVIVNPTSNTLALAQFALNNSRIVSKWADILLLRLDRILKSKVNRLVRSFAFLLLQAVVVLGNVGLAIGMSFIIISLQNDAKSRPEILKFFALKQSNIRRPAKGGRWTREASSQRSVRRGS